MKKQGLLITCLASVMLLAGCSSQPTIESTQPAMVGANEVQAPAAPEAAVTEPKTNDVPQQPKQAYQQPQLIKITGTGFGSESAFEGYTVGQRRLMAIRASKLDAYRALAEQLFGIKIDSNTQMSTLTARSDNFRARINAMVKGARVVSVTPMPDNNYETVLEVFVDKGFFNNNFVYTNCPNGNCEVKPIDPDNLCSSGYNCQSVDK